MRKSESISLVGEIATSIAIYECESGSQEDDLLDKGSTRDPDTIGQKYRYERRKWNKYQEKSDPKIKNRNMRE
jgi:hypothetical protein